MKNTRSCFQDIFATINKAIYEIPSVLSLEPEDLNLLIQPGSEIFFIQKEIDRYQIENSIRDLIFEAHLPKEIPANTWIDISGKEVDMGMIAEICEAFEKYIQQEPMISARKEEKEIVITLFCTY